MKTVRVGIVGFGTVGRATAEIMEAHRREIAVRCGAQLRVNWICNRSPIPLSAIPVGAQIQGDWRILVASPEVDIVVETIGGTGVAGEVVRAALLHGKPVVTANKALLAGHGQELLQLACERDLPLGFEAAVAGGIPVIRSIEQGTSGDRIVAVRGILNGTSNYILTRMEADGEDFETALLEAQNSGYAEQDPDADVDGRDARDKLAILARLAFGGYVSPQAVSVIGIRKVRPVDFLYARRLHSVIRLIASAELCGGKLAASVGPWLIPDRSMLAGVEGVNNAVLVVGERSGTQMFYGRGAGGDATAVAVLSDLMEIASDLALGKLQAKATAGLRDGTEVLMCQEPPPVPWYLRLLIRDQPGVLARVATALAAHQINIDCVLQEPGLPKSALPFVITVEPVSEPLLMSAVADINQDPALVEPVVLLRMQPSDYGQVNVDQRRRGER
ncbi:MAG TPA: homoserine dehydrogenase [Terriglobales bacterium]|nr:homoserine dehydrogenase [Terriglobales bacterium]